MTSVAPAPQAVRRWRTWRWVLLALVAIVAVAAVSTYLTAPRPGGRMDAESTSPDGANALVTLLRDRGVDVVVANTVADVERAARPDSLLLVAETYVLVNDDLMARLAAVPGDRLLIEPVSTTRKVLAPEIRIGRASTMGGKPNCDLPEATRAGEVQFGVSNTYRAAGDYRLSKCYDGAVVRYQAGGRTVTVVGSADFMMNSGLLKQGNAALAMNLAGTRPRLIWYAPQHAEGEKTGGSDIFDLIPDNVHWIVWQLGFAVLLARQAAGPAGSREAAGGGAGLGDRRGPRPVIPVAPRPRPGRRLIAHRRAATYAAAPRVGRQRRAGRGDRRGVCALRQEPRSVALLPLRTTPVVRRRPGEPLPRARRH
jgi:hypothetical protein